MSLHRKPENSRLNFFYIYHILQRYTDEQHPMAVQEIVDKVNRSFAVNEKRISADTVKRILEVVTQDIFPDSYYDDTAKHRYGFEIVSVVREGDAFVAYHPDKHLNAKRYYYMEHDFSTAEVKTLIDAVETYGYFSEDEVTELVNKLLRLRPRSFGLKDYYDRSYQLRDEDSLLLINIDDLNEIIRREHCARITYCRYNREKKLVPRDGYPRVVEPVDLMWSNGYYYLVAYNPKYASFSNYRIDRITYIEEVDEKPSHQMTGYDRVKYRNEHPVMFAGEQEHFRIRCKDDGNGYMLNAILDSFGRDVRIEDDGEGWFVFSCVSTPGGAELWAMQYADRSVILSPQSSAERVRERLKQANDMYGT